MFSSNNFALSCMMSKQHIVTLGWGTGSLMLLQWLKQHSDHIDISTILAMADDGGSTWRMRKEFHMPAFGWDFRDALVGLSDNDHLANIFMHRFNQGTELKGHSVGNLILLGLWEATGGDITKALEIAHEVLRVQWRVVPSTTDMIDLICTYDDGTVLSSQNAIDNTWGQAGKRIINTKLSPTPLAYPEAISLLRQADKIIMWPWDLYSNVIANILVEGIADAISSSWAEVIYVCNLMTKYNQTHNFTTVDFIEELKKYLGCYPSTVIVNNDFSPLGIDIAQYSEEQRQMVRDTTTDNVPYRVIRDKVWLEGKEFRRVASDVVPRSFIRHDPQKLAEIIVGV